MFNCPVCKDLQCNEIHNINVFYCTCGFLKVFFYSDELIHFEMYHKLEDKMVTLSVESRHNVHTFTCREENRGTSHSYLKQIFESISNEALVTKYLEK